MASTLSRSLHCQTYFLFILPHARPQHAVHCAEEWPSASIVAIHVASPIFPVRASRSPCCLWFASSFALIRPARAPSLLNSAPVWCKHTPASPIAYVMPCWHLALPPADRSPHGSLPSWA